MKGAYRSTAEASSKSPERASTRRSIVPLLTARGGGVLVTSLAVLAISVGTGTTELLPLVAAGAIALLIAPFSASHRARLACRRLLLEADVVPRVAAVGEAVRLKISLTNRPGRAAPPLAIEPAAPRWRRREPREHSGLPRSRAHETPSGIPRRFVAPLHLQSLVAPRPEATAVFTSLVPSTRRGVYVLKGSPTWACDPLGLFASPGPSMPRVTVLFHPRPDPDAAWPARVAGGRAKDEAGDGRAGARDGAGELDGIRPYVDGDRLTLVHWPAYARYGEWFVRQFAPQKGPMARLLVDDRAGVHRHADFERMLALAQGLLERAWHDGRTVELSTISGISIMLPPVPASLGLGRTMLATLQPRRSASRTAGWGEVPHPVDGSALVLSTKTGSQSLLGHFLMMTEAT